MQRYGRFNRPGLRGSANYALLGGTEGAAPSPPPGPPSPSWSLDFSSGTPSGYTLTRASTGTYVDSSGYVASAATDVARLTHNSSGSRLGLLVEGQRTNLCTTSENINGGGWVRTNVTVTTDTVTAPDNTSTADTVDEGTANSFHIAAMTGITVTNGDTFTNTIFMKKGTATVVQMYGESGAFGMNQWATFDLDAGTVTGRGTSTATDDATIENYGNGWYRCRLTMTATSGALNVGGLAFCNNNTAAGRVPSYTGTNKNLYVWGGQSEKNASPTSYIPTTTTSVTRSADIASVATSNITGFANNSTLLVEYYRPATNGMVTATNESFNIMGDTGYIGVRSVNTATQSDVAWGAGWTQSGANGNLTGTVNATLQKFAYTISSGGMILKSCMNGSMLTTTKTGDNPNMTLPDKLFLGQEEGGTLYSNVIIRNVAFYNSVLSDADMQTITT